MEGVVKMDNNYLVDIQHERLSFFTPAGEVKALNDVSIHLKEGEVLGIVGESGSGKSVTAYSLMGLTAYPGKLIGGELHFNGHEVEKMTEKDFSKMLTQASVVELKQDLVASGLADCSMEFRSV